MIRAIELSFYAAIYAILQYQRKSPHDMPAKVEGDGCHIIAPLLRKIPFYFCHLRKLARLLSRARRSRQACNGFRRFLPRLMRFLYISTCHSADDLSIVPGWRRATLARSADIQTRAHFGAPPRADGRALLQPRSMKLPRSRIGH